MLLPATGTSFITIIPASGTRKTAVQDRCA
jgi:hypothetical protein